MGHVLDFDLNPAFILLLRGLEIPIQSVDPPLTGCFSERYHFVQIKDQFLDRFNQVLSFKAFDFLQPDELCAVISGDSKPWTEEEIPADVWIVDHYFLTNAACAAE
jgi:hypothetical protein